MSVALRAATPDDAEGIAHVHVEGWRTTYRGLFPDALLDGLDVGRRAEGWREGLTNPDGRHTVVATADGAVIGFATGGPGRSQGFEAELYAIYLLPRHRRRGVGRLLMARMFRRFETESRRSAHLWVHEGNVAGEAFYRELGGVAGAREDHAEPAPHTVVSYGWDELGIARVAGMDWS